MSSAIETLYVNNINDKVSLNKLNEELTALFSTYGKIIQLTSNKNIKMKGQAFITFDNIQSSIKAQRELNNHSLFSKQIRVSFAKSNSDSYHTLIEKDEAIVEQRKSLKAAQSKKRVAEKVVVPKLQKKRKIEEFKELPPNKILLLQNILPKTKQELLDEHFEKFDGFVTVRFVGVKNLAFIEFETEPHAGIALDATMPHELFGESASLTYAKK